MMTDLQFSVRDYRPPLTHQHINHHHNLNLPTNQSDSYSIADQQLKLTFDLSGYKPDDVNVKLNDNVLKGKISLIEKQIESIRIYFSTSCSY